MNEQFLNAKDIASLRISNGIGTDITVGLPRTHKWHKTPNPNLDEFYTIADRQKVNGYLHIEKIAWQNQIIKDAHIQFEHGKVVGYGASSNRDLLIDIVEPDSGNCYVKEVLIGHHCQLILSETQDPSIRKYLNIGSKGVQIFMSAGPWNMGAFDDDIEAIG